MIHRLVWTWTALLALTLGDTTQVTAQVQLVSRAPRFVRISPVTRRLVDASHATILRREMSLNLDRSRLVDALDEISRTAGVKLIYSRDLVPLETPVTLKAATISLGAALTAVLFDTGLDVVISSDGEIALMKKAPISPLARAPSGSISGRVTDARTGAVVVGATVVVDGVRQSATTDADGRYRIADVAPGTYTVRARYIGYAPGTVSVTVTADEEVTADLALEKSAQRLDEVVTTGTVVPTEVKAVPTPVSVISEADIALQRPHTVQELIRQAVPTAVSWDVPAVPAQTAFSVRGASTLSPGNGQMKVFVDGIETAWPTFAAADPNSIERIEVIRGPQAAAIYGSDAIGGVVQIFTKRGEPSLTRPQVDMQAALGLVQTPYTGFDGVLRQSYAASVRGGGPEVSYNLGGGYSHTADYIPNGELSSQSNPTVYGGMRFARGIMTVDVSGRYYVQNNPAVFNPKLSQTGFVFWSRPLYQAAEYQNQAVGARASVAPTSWWQNTVTVGVDRFVQDIAQTRPRLTYPEDTLLQIFNRSRTKTFIGYNTSVQGSLGSDLSGSLTTGFDHYSLPLTQFFTSGALNTTGTIQTDPGQPVSVSRTTTNNTGYFAQVQLGFRDALFLTGGVRAERNTDFGDSLGTPVSPRVGLAYVTPIGEAAVKLRGSWGRAIRASSPGQKLAFGSSDQIGLANPQLGPERQKGWDAGLDVAFGGRGSLSVTYYDQIAEDLIQLVLVRTDPVPTSQYQNVGRVKNSGVEVEGTLSLGPLQLKGQYGYARSRVDALPPNYAGDLRVGDQSLATPKHTAGASLTVTPLRRTTVAAGLTYVGSWTYYDYLAEFACFGGTGPCEPSTRDYLIGYPGFVKVNATVSQQITPLVSGFVSVDNLANNQAYEIYNGAPAIGRISMAGFRLRY